MTPDLANLVVLAVMAGCALVSLSALWALTLAKVTAGLGHRSTPQTSLVDVLLRLER